MKEKTIFSLSVGALVVAFLGWNAVAAEKGGAAKAAGQPAPGPSTTAKEPSLLKSLQAISKNLAKVKSYRASIHIDGGLTDRADHKVNGQRVANDDYEGEVYESTMHVPQPKAYRRAGKGVAYVDGLWRDILSDMNTKRLEKFFPFPDKVLSLALQNAAQTGRWLKREELTGDFPERDEDESSDGAESTKPEKAEPEKKAEKPGKAGNAGAKKPAPSDHPGKTVLAPVPKTASELAKESMPRYLRVDATPKEALVIFTDVQNSGCMGGC